ncbi:hypothetical protein C8R43DRAFT_964243 [Mycena crocata]|nr:hypothetical protein C8R43DRAFT_964243 [Mycena crocata]
MTEVRNSVKAVKTPEIWQEEAAWTTGVEASSAGLWNGVQAARAASDDERTALRVILHRCISDFPDVGANELNNFQNCQCAMDCLDPSGMKGGGYLVLNSGSKYDCSNDLKPCIHCYNGTKKPVASHGPSPSLGLASLVPGFGLGLSILKPKPPQAEPKPGLPGRGGPWTSLSRRATQILVAHGSNFQQLLVSQHQKVEAVYHTLGEWSKQELQQEMAIKK